MFRYLLTISMLSLLVAADVFAFDHDIFATVVKKHVIMQDGGKSSTVDYHQLLQDEATLDRYLERLGAVLQADFDSWEKPEQLAFLINAYNAWTLKLILGAYPDLESIKDLGSLFQSPWKKRFIPLLEETRSLDDIEHGLIRGSGRYNDPRIHFAVNCASIGCPALRNEAYRGDRLEAQLEEATRLFLADRSRNRAVGDNTLEISSIFKWYKEDFESGWRDAATLARFLALYGASLGLDAEQIGQLRAGAYDITYLDYDWELNDHR